MKNILKHSILGLIGGIIYILLELLWRGYSHWTMFIIGGIAFISIGLINEYFTYNTSLWKQCALSMLLITTIEFVSGCIINILLHMNVWNYYRFDVLGQICIPYMILWFFLSSFGIILDDILRWKLFCEERPHYTIF